MKVTEPPNRFFPGRAYTTEDVNRNLSHAANTIKADQDNRYVYTSIRIPLACVSEYQFYGPAPDYKPATPVLGELEGNSSVPDDAGATPLSPNNHEGLRTFSFIPPFNMKIVSTDLYVIGNTSDATAGSTQISPDVPMVAKVQWISEDGGQGFPKRPRSVIPDGVRLDKDPDLYRIHDQFSMDITAKGGYFSRTDNSELMLEGGKCYRLCLSSPDIPVVSNTFGVKTGYNQTWFWRYDAAWVQLNFQYDKWQFDKVNRPDITFYTAKDMVTRGSTPGDGGIQTQVDALEISKQATAKNLRYPKAELYTFGMGNFNGMWSRPSGAASINANVNTITDQAKSLSAGVPNSVQDSWKKYCIPDLSYKYSGAIGGSTIAILSSRYAHNFESQVMWRSPLSPLTSSNVEHDGGKKLYGYSLGFMHNTSPNMWENDTEYGASIPRTYSRIRHTGFEFHARLGHGFGFRPTPQTQPNCYSIYNSNSVNASLNQTTPVVRQQNNTDGGGLVGIPNGGDLKWNNTQWGSTSIPTPYSTAEKHFGLATGFPGDYLAEVHSGPQYGQDPNRPEFSGSPQTLSSLSTSKENFTKPPDVSFKHPADLSKLNDQNELFLQLNTYVSQTVLTQWDTDVSRRNFQKVYVLMWVL